MSQAFQNLSHFIRERMRMSHIYQPVMLIELLQNKGAASVTEIARALLNYDEAQLEYYEQIVKRMPGQVLTKNRKITSKTGDAYALIGFEGLSDDEIEQLIGLCREKIDAFLRRRGNIWDHRKKSAGYISGTARYEILKKAKFRCELCGAAADQKALQVDHIIPRAAGGTDDLSNLQALCYTCNPAKGKRDDTDFRQVRASYGNRQAACVFCEMPPSRILAANELAYAVKDAFPVTKDHRLVVPKRHVADYFALYQPERNAINQLLEDQREAILKADASVSGFNIGSNVGADAGQTIMHCHIHIIPRRQGDSDDPAGGVRAVIPDKQQYPSP